jgi:hypothetical protein
MRVQLLKWRIMNNKIWVWIGLLLFACRSVAVAASTDLNRAGSLGLGIELGQPIGITGTLWVSDMSAVDATMGYHWNHNFDAHADYLVHTNALTPTMNGTLPVYAGFGARILAGDDTQFGLRIPFGISYFWREQHLEFFAEIAPVIDLSNIGADVDGSVGIRLYAF